MKKLLLPPLPLYLLPLFFQIATLLSAPIYTPVDDITINCGSSGTSLNMDDNRNWTGDINSKLSPSEFNQANTNTSSQVREAPTSSSVSQVPYTMARLSRSEFTYKVPLSTGQKFIRFYFRPVSYGPDFDRSKALFSVQAGGFTLLHDFNASVTADAGKTEKLIREFCLNIDEGQSLTITFTPNRAISDAYAFINGIEIVSMPTNLYYTPPENRYGADFVGNGNNYLIENSTAMETVYRINVGGSGLSFDQDTGMYRNWDSVVEEQKYLDELSSRWTVLPQNVSIKPNFVKIPEYSAPDAVYQTGRSMGKNHTQNKSYNLTWEFPVDPKFFYLLRLHFCEFEPEIIDTGYRSFIIYIANQTAEPQADIIMWSGGNGRPIYKDYVVYMPAGPDQKKVKLFLALQANRRDWMTAYNDVLLNGLELFKLSDTNGNLAGPNPDPPPPKPMQPKTPSKQSKKKSTPMLAIVAGAVSAILVLFCVLGFFVFSRRRRDKDTDDDPFVPSGLCREFSLSEIKAATRNFNEGSIIGVGGFGHVYKGSIDQGTLVAIKRLKPESQQGVPEFRAEIDVLSQLRHQHLVSLIGYCKDRREMILVYEYMENKTLNDHLMNPKSDPNAQPLPWEKRLQICIGAARGLHYLHTGGTEGTIIHRDVKSTNILLDEKWVAKVSDFGLSKMGSMTMSKTHITTTVKGSYGYLDPEYMLRNQLTEKSDVYSFGVVLCEVLCARPALMRTVEKKEMSLAMWFKACHQNGELDQIIDPSLKGKIEDECFKVFVEIALSCMHENGKQRPSMNNVVEGLVQALKLQQNGDKMDEDDETKGEKKAAIMNESDGGFSSSWTESSDSKNSSRVTNMSSDQSCSTTNNSIKGMSGTVFSEIKDPSGR
ncbi:PREDICTED: receptor-like protein kinase FERONIA [Prunus mume]|uniref:Receptor-like protein kinase FERONIA n=1 Tax=Prunus mume TaxID=102107 RepID=A0ABM0NWN5_PRUMU|nr:PREDICTED: receptor-like protein kinase FERONIA [Prunus mume]